MLRQSSRAAMKLRVFWLKHRMAFDWAYMIFCVGILWLFLSYAEGYYDLYSSPLYELALAGDASAQTRTGLLLIAERGNYSEAKIWLERAARKGEPVAQYNLGLLLYNREGSEGIKAAKRWFLISAQSGFEPARTILQKLERQSKNSGVSQIIESRINEIRENLHLLSQ